MRAYLGLLGWACGLLALFFNVANAISLWGAIGGLLAVGAFPLMFLVVPIALLMRGEIPLYWLLLPAWGVLYALAREPE